MKLAPGRIDECIPCVLANVARCAVVAVLGWLVAFVQRCCIWATGWRLGWPVDKSLVGLLGWVYG